MAKVILVEKKMFREFLFIDLDSFIIFLRSSSGIKAGINNTSDVPSTWEIKLSLLNQQSKEEAPTE